ncbi:MAG TPA: alpha-amylase family glycosyl hydrolase [Candidatus Paceibacterota bacterium]|nr:alpha-amylase family glycosyl hydrolase [Verrucomicrobiota bacterium]HSA09847.1 alpha-amylase family glycosyl hydrolase [Candidatus Paceibacterota bacterium]
MNLIKQELHRLFAAIAIGSLTLNVAGAAETESAAPSARKSPDWLRSAVVYEVFTRNFSPAGDFNGITSRLDELKDLGVDILWLMPINPVGEKLKKGTLGSPYCVRDFHAINPACGTTNDFKRLVEEVHKRDMKIIIDIVAGQTSWDSALMAHPEYYLKNEKGQIIPPNPAWTDVAGLNYENSDLRRYMIDMMKYWLKNFNLDGFRCDVAYTVPVDFWETARAELEKVNPQLIIIADAGARPSLLTKAFDMDYSWNLYSWLKNVMDSVSTADMLRQSFEHTHQQFPKGVLHLRFTDNQSETRATVRYGLRGALAAQVLMLTLDGVPLFYNGQEVGDATESGDPAMFEKMPVFWNPGGRPPLRDIYRDLIKLRKKYAAFCNEDVIWVQNSAPGEVVSFLRRDAKDEFLVLINLSSRRAAGTLEMPSQEGFGAVKITGMPEPLNTALPDFNLNGYGWYIFHRSGSK